MLITKNDIELRNLQEQVQKNKEDIAKHYEIDRTLSNFGIKIVGTVATVNDLPDPLYYEGEYGDGYAVGQPGNYTYYLFTRPDPNAGIYENHWLDVGQLAIRGPEGPVGPEGPQGPRGDATMWYTSSAEAANGKPGDLWLDKHGWIYKKSKEENVWTSFTNIKGPQGIQGPRGPQGEKGETGLQGPKGDTGDVGGFINIAGVLTSSNQLPDPATIKNLTIAYLVGTSTPQDLYIQVGSDSDTAIWENMGPLNVATYVTVNGQYQNTWNADTKLDKITDAYQIYATGKNGEQRSYRFSSSGIPETIMFREWGSGTCNIADPIEPLNIANKRYVDTAVNTKLDLIEPSRIETDFVTIVKDNNGYHQENMIGTYTPETSNKFAGVLRGTQGDIRGMVPANPHSYTLVNIEYLKANASNIYSIEASRPDGTKVIARLHINAEYTGSYTNATQIINFLNNSPNIVVLDIKMLNTTTNSFKRIEDIDAIVQVQNASWGCRGIAFGTDGYQPSVVIQMTVGDNITLKRYQVVKA